MCPSSTSSSERVEGCVGADGVVVVPEDVGARPGRRALAVFVVALFSVVLAGTLVIDTLRPERPPRLQGGEQREDAARRARARLFDGSAAALLEHDLNMTSRVRRTLAPPYSYVLLRYFGEAAKAVIVGPDGWLFLRGRVIPPGDSVQRIVGLPAAKLAALDRRLAGAQVRLIVLPIPRKSVIYGDQLPNGVHARPEIDQALGPELARRGVEYVDLLTAFLEARDEQLFFKYGTHWTDAGRSIAAQLIAARLGFDKHPDERATRLVSDPRSSADLDLVRAAGVADPEWAARFTDPGARGVKVEPVPGRSRPEWSTDARQPIALAGTSYSAGGVLRSLIEHHVDRPVLDAARAGLDPSETLRALLVGGPASAHPEVVILDLPVNFLFARDPLPGLAPIFAAWPPRTQTPVLPANRIQRPPETAGATMALRRRASSIAKLGASVLAHSGDGVANLRLRGSRTGGPVTILIQQMGSPTAYEWPIEQEELVLPLLGWAPTQHALNVSAMTPAVDGGATLRIDELEIVAAGDAERALELVCDPPVPLDGGGWVQVSKPVGDSGLPKHGILHVQLDADAPIEGRIQVVIEAVDAEPMSYAFETLHPRGALVLDLSALAGRELTAVRLRGAGARLKKLVAFARVLPP